MLIALEASYHTRVHVVGNVYEESKILYDKRYLELIITREKETKGRTDVGLVRGPPVEDWEESLKDLKDETQSWKNVDAQTYAVTK